MKKRIISLLLSIFFMPAVIILTGILSIPLSLVVSNLSSMSLELASEAILVVATLVMAYAFFKIQKRDFHIGLSVKGRGRDILEGFLVAASIYLIGYLISLMLGFIEITSSSFNLGNFLGMFLMFILVAIAEECAFRGYILSTLLDSGLGKYTSLAISSLLFSLMHLLNPDFSWMALVNIFLAGVLLGACYIYTRNLWYAFSLHLFWNFIQGPVLGYNVSGNEFAGGILSTVTKGSDLLSGGGFGFEGSLVCTIISIIYSVLILRYMHKKHSNIETCD